MIFIALYLFYSLGLLAVMGLLTGKFLSKLFSLPLPLTSLGFSNTLLLGIISLTTILSYFSLFSPINVLAHLLILLSLAGLTFFNRTYIFSAVKATYGQLRQNNYLLFAGGICLLAGIVFASGPVKSYDTGLYHAQSVKWINEYGVVPGLGNLHFRLAFNSSWLVFSSFFDILAFEGKSYHLVNLIIFVIGVTICLKGLADVINNSIKISSVIRSLLVLYYFARYKEIASLSTDFPATSLLFFTLILAVEFVEKRLEQDGINSTPHNISGESGTTFFLSFYLPPLR